MSYQPAEMKHYPLGILKRLKEINDERWEPGIAGNECGAALHS